MVKRKRKFNMNYYYEFIFKFILNDCNKHSKKLLDIGCGSGNLLEMAQQSGFKTYGIDLSYIAIKQAKKKLIFTELVLSNAENLPWRNSCFDYVTSICSIEHHLNQDKSIKEICRVLKDDGKAYLLLPNSFFIHDLLQIWLKGKSPTHGEIIERFATAKNWKKLLEKNGLQVNEIIKYNQKRGIFVNLIRPFIPFNLSKHFLFICNKKS